MENREMLGANKEFYQEMYDKKEGFLRYPADWIIRFHNIYLKKEIPSGRVLDYGCGAGNNSVFFLEKGYEVYGVDVCKSFMDLVKANLMSRNLDAALLKNFTLISPDSTALPFQDNFFDLIISNQALYYLPSQEHIKLVCKELCRCLKPGGAVFFTMMGPKNYYIKHHAKQIHNGSVYEVNIDDPKNRLYGRREFIYLVRDEDELRSLFSEFEPVGTGYFDQSMLDLKSNFHFIFIGKKRA